jgi:serine/threonine protein kinase
MAWTEGAHTWPRVRQPSNVLLDRKCNVKVADFGLARSVAQLEPDGGLIMTDYVATRWYTPPPPLIMTDYVATRWYTPPPPLAWPPSGVPCIETKRNHSRFPASALSTQPSQRRRSKRL